MEVSAVAAQLLYLIEYHRAEAQLGQHVLPASKNEIMADIDIRLGQVIGRKSLNNMHP